MFRIRSSLHFLAALSFCIAGDSSAQSSTPCSNSKLTSDQAVAAVRSKELNSGASLDVIRELVSSCTTQDNAQRAPHASSQTVNRREDPILLDLIRSGGFLILEVDRSSGEALQLHLVSIGADGRPVINSRRVEGRVSAGLAHDLIKATAEFVDLLLTDSINVGTLVNRFYAGHFPESQGIDEDETQNLFATPHDVGNVGAAPSETQEFALLSGTIDIWTIRYAISNPNFPVDPTQALSSAIAKREKLAKEFSRSKNESPDFLRKPLQTREQLRNRLATFRSFNDFLQQKLTADPSTSFAANRSISTVALYVGSIGAPDEISYPVMTASGIIVDWKLLDSGALKVARVSLAGD